MVNLRLIMVYEREDKIIETYKLLYSNKMLFK